MESSANIIAAWWGAIIATLLFIWDIYKHCTSGAKLFITTHVNMRAINIPNREGKDWILVTVTNNGTIPATITQVAGLYYKNWFRLVIRKPNKAFIQGGAPLPGYEFPYVLSPGQTWQGTMVQDDETIKMAKNGYLYCLVSHSSKKLPLKTRIII